LARAELFCSWSGGKDSCLALHRATADGARARCLITAMVEHGGRSRSHGLRAGLLEAQARALGLELRLVPTSWAGYERAMGAAFARLAGEELRDGVFGDIDLDDHRDWCRRICTAAGARALHPLWGEERRALVAELIALGYVARIVAVRDGVVDAGLLGERLTARLAGELEAAGIDACGELGEFHTVVTDGPAFAAPVRVRAGRRVLRDGCWFLDLAPAA
jgi:uncharacterized protein (TIGR00290 family)